MADKKESTLRCVTVLVVIAVVCAVLLAVLNPLLYVAPSLDDITNYFDGSLVTGYDVANWTMEELDGDNQKQNGGSVTMVAKYQTETDTVYGILIKTNSNGKLGESTFVTFVDGKTNSLVKAATVTDGSTSGYSMEYAKSKLGDKLKDFEDYYTEISSADVFDDGYSVPKGGATLTMTAVNNAFRICATYYYNVYGGAKA